MKPILIKNLNIKSEQTTDILSSIPIDSPPYNESWLQDLIHNHPNLVPAGEVEACFENIIPVVREFTVPSGSLDNFYVTPDGYPVLVEVKLWKNQESRRKVVAQILEYAKDFAGMPYEAINKEIRQKYKDRIWGENPLYELVTSAVPNADEEQVFVNRVTRNLKEGRFLLLILGDGIREDMAALAEYLMHHSLRYAFGIIQVQLFKLPDGNVIALPSVITKTQTIERHVTIVTTKDYTVNVNPQIPVISERVEKTSLSLESFYDTMAEADRNFIKDVLGYLTDLDVEAEIGSNGKNLMLKKTLMSADGERLQFMLITPAGAEFWGIPYRGWKYPDWQKLSLSYLERIAGLVTGATVKIQTTQADIKINNSKLPLQALHGKAKDVADIIRQAIGDAERFYITNSP